MPLSKAKNRDRMRESRLHAKKDTVPVQPKPSLYGWNKAIQEMAGIEGVDADGNPVYEG